MKDLRDHAVPTHLTHFLLLFLLIFLAGVALDAEGPAPEDTPMPAIRISTHLVLLDVVAVDGGGKAVADLKADDFVVEDGGKKQKISSFSFESAQNGAASLPTLPAGVYSNRPAYTMPPGPLTILLLDSLNTTVQNQAYARGKMLQYVSTQLKPGQRIAVFGLTNHLIKLQDFTSDPDVLRAAIERFSPVSLAANVKSTPNSVKGSTAMATSQTIRGGTSLLATTNASAIVGLQAFETDQAATALQARIEDTLEALRQIARAMGGHSGRKNLLWVSSGFPFTLVPEDPEQSSLSDRVGDPTAPPPTPNQGNVDSLGTNLLTNYTEQIRRVSALLSDAQTAIYPVDARGLLGSPLVDASKTGLNSSGLLTIGQEYGRSVVRSTDSLNSSQQNMGDLARQTGGRAFINRNDIDNAVAIASQEGTASYTIGYYPQNKKWDGGFHRVKLKVSRPGVQLRYRAGYFAIDPGKTKASEQDSAVNNAIRSNAAEATMVLFDAKAGEAGGKTRVQFLVDPKSFSAEDVEGGKKHLSLNFYVSAFSPDGKLVKNEGKVVDATLEAEQFAQVQKMGLLMPLELSLGKGDYQLRLAVRDNRTGFIGTLGIPIGLR